ncbi:hypothetical protein BT69DRAFT_1350462, partial [Atractiella rhizophila]
MDGLPIRPRPGASIDEIDASFASSGRPSAKVVRPSKTPPAWAQTSPTPHQAPESLKTSPKPPSSAILLGGIVEQARSNAIPLPPTLQDSPPIPIAEKKQSRFARARAERERIASSTSSGFPASQKITIPSEPPPPPRSRGLDEPNSNQPKNDTEDLLRSVSDENERLLASMTEEQIEIERQQIAELGLSKELINMLRNRGISKSNILSSSSSTVGSESVPPAARSEATTITVSKPPVKDNLQLGDKNRKEEDEGTPEHIRRTYFPNEPDPSPSGALDWIIGSSSVSSPPRLEGEKTVDIVFDLQGNASLSSVSAQEAHAHPHSHHASNSSNPSFSITSLLSVLGSEVVAQRSAAFQLAGRILRRIRAGGYGELQPGIVEGMKKHKFEMEVVKRASVGFLLKERNQRLIGATVEALESLMGLPDIEVASMEELYTWGVENWEKELEPQVENKVVEASPAAFFAHSGAIKELHEGQYQERSPSSFSPSFSTLLSVRNWPSPRNLAPSRVPLIYLHVLVSSSRASSERLLSSTTADTLLRFLAVPPWHAAGVEDEAHDLGGLVLGIYERLAEYGLGCDVLRVATPVFEVFERRFVDGKNIDEERDKALFERWISLKVAWTIAAMNPHYVTPHHDIVWTQVEEMALSSFQTLKNVAPQRDCRIVAPLLTLAAYALEGLKATNADKGIVAFEQASKMLETVQGDINEIRGMSSEEIFNSKTSQECLLAAKLLTGYLQLYAQLPQMLGDKIDANVYSSLLRHLATENFGALHLPILNLCVDAVQALPMIQKLPLAFILLPLLRTGHETIAVRILDSLMVVLAGSTVSPDPFVLDLQLEVPSLVHLPLIRPLMAEVLSVEPASQQAHKYSRLSTMDRQLQPYDQLLRPDWMFVGVDYLLRSRSQEPDTQIAEEVEVTRVSLVLSRMSLLAHISNGVKVDRSLLLFNIMKVYMLEKNRPFTSVDSSQQLFRDSSVSHSISSLLTALSQSKPLARSQGLETASKAFLRTTPFYQFYSDLLGIFEAVSFGDQAFAKMLILPLSMRYPSDYRSLLWKDYLHVARDIRLSVQDAVLEDYWVNLLLRLLYFSAPTSAYFKAAASKFVGELKHAPTSPGAGRGDGKEREQVPGGTAATTGGEVVATIGHLVTKTKRARLSATSTSTSPSTATSTSPHLHLPPTTRAPAASPTPAIAYPATADFASSLPSTPPYVCRDRSRCCISPASCHLPTYHDDEEHRSDQTDPRNFRDSRTYSHASPAASFLNPNLPHLHQPENVGIRMQKENDKSRKGPIFSLKTGVGFQLYNGGEEGGDESAGEQAANVDPLEEDLAASGAVGGGCVSGGSGRVWKVRGAAAMGAERRWIFLLKELKAPTGQEAPPTPNPAPPSLSFPSLSPPLSPDLSRKAEHYDNLTLPTYIASGSSADPFVFGASTGENASEDLLPSFTFGGNHPSDSRTAHSSANSSQNVPSVESTSKEDTPLLRRSQNLRSYIPPPSPSPSSSPSNSDPHAPPHSQEEEEHFHDSELGEELEEGEAPRASLFHYDTPTREHLSALCEDLDHLISLSPRSKFSHLSSLREQEREDRSWAESFLSPPPIMARSLSPVPEEDEPNSSVSVDGIGEGEGGRDGGGERSGVVGRVSVGRSAKRIRLMDARERDEEGWEEERRRRERERWERRDGRATVADIMKRRRRARKVSEESAGTDEKVSGSPLAQKGFFEEQEWMDDEEKENLDLDLESDGESERVTQTVPEKLRMGNALMDRIRAGGNVAYHDDEEDEEEGYEEYAEYDEPDRLDVRVDGDGVNNDDFTDSEFEEEADGGLSLPPPIQPSYIDDNDDDSCEDPDFAIPPPAP